MAFVACDTSISFAVYFLWKSDIIIAWKRNSETQKLEIINQQGGHIVVDNLKGDHIIIHNLFLVFPAAFLEFT